MNGRDMLAYNIRSDETTVLADGKEKQSLYSLSLSVHLMCVALSLL